MSIIRNLLYNGSSFDALYSGILYNQSLLHNFILQHQPKFILHCGCPENALDLAYFIKENQPCEILHIKNWNPSTSHWRQATGEAPNPHKLFLDKIFEYKLEDHLASFDGFSETAFEVLNYRNFRFNMMISDNIGDSIDYLPLLKLLQKNALHIRYIGDKKMSDIKNEPIFQADIETSFTYAQGYLITGMDYLSLYDSQHHNAHTSENNTTISQKTHISPETNDSKDQEESNVVWNGYEFSYQEDTHDHDNDDRANTHTHINDEQKQSHQRETEKKLSPQEERELKRLERRKAREERRILRHQEANNKVNHTENQYSDTKETQKNQNNNTTTINSLLPFNIEDDGGSAISAARRALRARRTARRLKSMNNEQ